MINLLLYSQTGVAFVYISAISAFRPQQYGRVRKPMPSSNPPKRFTQETYLKYYYDIPFEGTTSAGKPLRQLKNITCPYTGVKIIPGNALKGFEKNLEKCKKLCYNHRKLNHDSV